VCIGKLELIKARETPPHELAFGVALGSIQIQNGIRAPIIDMILGHLHLSKGLPGLTAFPIQYKKWSYKLHASDVQYCA